MRHNTLFGNVNRIDFQTFAKIQICGSRVTTDQFATDNKTYLQMP